MPTRRCEKRQWKETPAPYAGGMKNMKKPIAALVTCMLAIGIAAPVHATGDKGSDRFANTEPLEPRAAAPMPPTPLPRFRAPPLCCSRPCAGGAARHGNWAYRPSSGAPIS